MSESLTLPIPILPMATKKNSWSPCPVWNDIISTFLESETGQKVKQTIKEKRESGVTIFPEPQDLFKAFRLCHYDKLKVVILGQDPYHNGVADGLAFSSKNPGKRPPSLKNIFAEIMRTEYGPGVVDAYVFPTNDLTPWAEQGVLLLNTALSVESGKAGSHAKLGWDGLITAVMKKCNEHPKPVVYMLWGNQAKDYGELVTNPNHLKLEGYHPQAQNYPGGDSKAFVGNNHFEQCEQFFVKKQILNINWRTTT